MTQASSHEGDKVILLKVQCTQAVCSQIQQKVSMLMQHICSAYTWLTRSLHALANVLGQKALVVDVPLA